MQPNRRLSDIPCLAVGGTRLDRLSSLFDLLEDGVVAERVFGDNLGSLVLEGHFVRLDACRRISLCDHDE
jgi:hypothetical protein